MSWQVFSGTLEQGLMYAIMVLGVYLTFRVLDYADLSVDGSFTLGASIAASLIYAGNNPWLATAVAFVGGCLAGVFTGVLHTKFKITPLLSGILTMTALYSVNLRIMGRPNIPLLRTRTIFSDFAQLPFMQDYGVLVLSLLTVVILGFLVYIFLQTTLFGKAVRAVIQDKDGARLMGVVTRRIYIFCFAAAFAMAGLAGALISMFYTISPFIGLPYTMMAFIVVILGGLGNILGSFLGGLLLGVITTAGVTLTTPGYGFIIQYLLFIAVLILKPQGIFGRRMQ